MGKAKFSVGDKVQLITDSCEYYKERYSLNYAGYVYTVKEIDNRGEGEARLYTLEELEWAFYEFELELDY